MPGNKGFTSKAQQGYMFMHHPEIAKRMARETPGSMKKLPMHVAHGGRMGYSDGGSIGTRRSASSPTETGLTGPSSYDPYEEARPYHGPSQADLDRRQSEQQMANRESSLSKLHKMMRGGIVKGPAHEEEDADGHIYGMYGGGYVEGGMVECPHCGHQFAHEYEDAEVQHHAEGGEVETYAGREMDYPFDDPHYSEFAHALKSRR